MYLHTAPKITRLARLKPNCKYARPKKKHQPCIVVMAFLRLRLYTTLIWLIGLTALHWSSQLTTLHLEQWYSDIQCRSPGSSAGSSSGSLPGGCLGGWPRCRTRAPEHQWSPGRRREPLGCRGDSCSPAERPRGCGPADWSGWCPAASSVTHTHTHTHTRFHPSAPAPCGSNKKLLLFIFFCIKYYGDLVTLK